MQPDVNSLAYDRQATDIMERVARSQYKRRHRAFDELAILSWQDLEQELWLKLLVEQERGRLLVGFVASEQDFVDHLVSLSEVMAFKGRRRAKHGHSIPMSQLTKRDKHKLWHKRGYSLEATFDELYERQEYWS